MKRTMKKMLSFGLVAAMSLTMLAGCGNSKDATNDTNVSNGQEKKKADRRCQDWCSGSGCQW